MADGDQFQQDLGGFNMRNRVRTLFVAGFAAGALSLAPVAHSVEGGTTEGCTPGYWKVEQHWDSWQDASPTDLLVGMYSEAGRYDSLEDLTLVEALRARGGSGAEGAARILARAAVAAWLNAAYDDDEGHLQYPWRREVAAFGNPALVDAVNAALESGKRAEMLKLARQLDEANNLGCPLS